MAGGAMNRREFVKALAGIPLLRLLVRLPGPEVEGRLMFVDSESYGLSIGSADEAGRDDWHYIGDKEPFYQYWNAQDSTEPVLRY
jgi:hypothetical protein